MQNKSTFVLIGAIALVAILLVSSGNVFVSSTEQTISYYFNEYDENIVWQTYPEGMVDGIPSLHYNNGDFASTNIDGDVQKLVGNTCDGAELGAIQKVEARIFGLTVRSHMSTGTQCYSNSNFEVNFMLGANVFNLKTNELIGGWTDYYDITSLDAEWTWQKVRDIDAEVICNIDTTDCFTSSIPKTRCCMVELIITYLGEDLEPEPEPEPEPETTEPEPTPEPEPEQDQVQEPVQGGTEPIDTLPKQPDTSFPLFEWGGLLIALVVVYIALDKKRKK